MRYIMYIVFFKSPVIYFDRVVANTFLQTIR